MTDDEAAIQQVLSAYSVATSRGDDARVLELFTEDGVWSVPGIGVHLEGLEQVRGGMAQIRSQFDYIVQVNGAAEITVSGDNARAASVIRESGKYVDREVAVDILGIYEDDLVRTPDGWKFRRRLFDLQGMHDFPLQARQA
jgi:uncharacterized protein (TIGR02246 family)